MTWTPASRGINTRRPMIAEEEVQELGARHGEPIRRGHLLQADEYIRRYRWRTDSDRRAEVVFAIQDPAGRILLHAKAHYPARIYRVLSGGVAWEEAIELSLITI